jgi:TonB family protein
MKYVFSFFFLLFATFSYSQQENDKVYETPEIQAEFPDGMTAMFKFMAQNVKLVAAKDDGSEFLPYAMVIKFQVSKDGTPSFLEIKKSSGSKGFDENVREAIEKMPKWKPAINNGQAVNSIFTLPIQFCR